MHQIKLLNWQHYSKCNLEMFWPKNKDIIHQENTAWEKSSLYDSLNGYMSCLYVTSSHNVVASAVCHWDFMPCNSEFTQRCCSVVYCSRMNHLHNTGRRNLLTMAIMLKMMMGMIIKSLMCSCSFILRRILLWYSAMGFNGQFLKRCTFSFESKKDLSEMSGHWKGMIQNELPFSCVVFSESSCHEEQFTVNQNTRVMIARRLTGSDCRF